MALAATHCASCGQRPPTDQELAVRKLNLEVQATNFGALLTCGITGFFFPPVISVTDGRIKITKWSFFGLRTDHQEIQVSRVASVRYTKGVIWGGLLIETFGGAAEDLAQRGLRQEDARTMAEQLKSVLTDRN